MNKGSPKGPEPAVRKKRLFGVQWVWGTKREEQMRSPHPQGRGRVEIARSLCKLDIRLELSSWRRSKELGGYVITPWAVLSEENPDKSDEKQWRRLSETNPFPGQRNQRKELWKTNPRQRAA